MKKTTKLMSKLFSDSTPNQFKEDVMDKIEEAKKNGSSEYSDETSDLKMARIFTVFPWHRWDIVWIRIF